MTPKTIQSSGIGPVVLIGAGLCAALLFSVARQGTLQAMALAYVTPLPIMISTIGFGFGLGSVAVGTLTVALLAALHQGALTGDMLEAGAIAGGVFALTQALPAWWLGFLFCLAKADESGRWHIPPADRKVPQLVFYPIGHILLHAAVIVIGISSLITAIIIASFGSIDIALESLAKEVSPLIQQYLENWPGLPAGIDIKSLTKLLLRAVPAMIAASSLMMFIANLWLAGRVVQTSNRLRRPWPDIAHELRLPRLLMLIFAAAFGLCFITDWPGAIGLIAAVTFGMIYALQGIAVVHDLSRGWRWRTPLLFVIYGALVVFISWPLTLFTLIGLADSVFSLRDRRAAAVLASKI